MCNGHPLKVSELGQRLFRAAKKSREAATKNSFAVLCIDRGDEWEEMEVKEAGCTRLLSVCKGVTEATLLEDRLDLPAMESIKSCVNRLLCKGQESIAGITFDVSSLWLKHQGSLRQAFPQLPILTPMMQLPFIWNCIGATGKTLIVTWNEMDLDETMFEKSRAEVLTVDSSDPKWSHFLSGKKGDQDLLKDLVDMLQQRLDQVGHAAESIILDSMLSKFTKSLRKAFRVPVFDEVSMLELFSAACSLSHFSDANVLGRLEKSESKREGGQLGLVRLEHDYVAGVGDIDHESTLNFGTCPAVVPGLTFQEAQRGSRDDAIVENLKRVLEKMESEHCFGIAGNCGFMHFYQELLRDSAHVPVFMSALVQVPTMALALDADERILILTANESSFMKSREKLLSVDGKAFCDLDRLLVRGCEDVPGFEAVAKAERVDNLQVEQNLVSFVHEILEQEKSRPIKSILLECTQMPHYAAALRRSTGLPVFDVVTCVNFFKKLLREE